MARTLSVGEVATRSYWREAEARVMVAAWRDSGESLAAFCDRYGIASKRVSRWVKRLSAAEMQFHPVEVVHGTEPTDERLELELVSGATVRLPPGFAVDDLRHILGVLAEHGRC